MPVARTDLLRLLAPSGRIRVGINLGNRPLVQKPSDGGPLRGVSIDLAHALAAELDVPHDLVGYDAAGKVTQATGEWDVGFLAVDPTRAERLAFTPAYVQIGACYMVHADSVLQTPDAVDVPGRRVALARGAGYDLHLTRTLRHAQLERLPTALEAFACFEDQRLDAAACLRGVMRPYAASRPHLRLMEQDFLKIDQALCVPRSAMVGLEREFAWLADWVEGKKKSGFVAESLRNSGQVDIAVAPPH